MPDLVSIDPSGLQCTPWMGLPDVCGVGKDREYRLYVVPSPGVPQIGLTASL